MIGRRVVLFSDGYMYVGNLGNGIPMIQGLTIHLLDAVVAPVSASPSQGSVIALPDVFVRWERVSAFGPAEHFQLTHQAPQPESQESP